MGDVVEMTEQEIKEFRNKIYSAYNEFQKTNNLFALTNFIVWCYEYLESYAATKLVTNAKLSLIKKYFESIQKWDIKYQDIIKTLFYVRVKIVHKPYLINYSLNSSISYANKHECINPFKFYNDNNEALQEILKIVELDLNDQSKIKEIHAFF